MPPARRRRVVVAVASLRLALARRSGQLTEVMEQVNVLDASITHESSEPVAMGTELRGVALMNLGIIETWSGRFEAAERHLSEGAALAQKIGRPYLEVTCRAYQAFPSTLVSLTNARERGRHALALAERYGWDDRPVVAPALGALAAIALWMGEFEEGERLLRRGWEVVHADIDPAGAVLLHMGTGMLHSARCPGRRSPYDAATQLSGLRTRRSTCARWPRAPSSGSSERRRRRRRGRARCRRARSADLPVCHVQGRGAARRAPESRNGSWRASRRHRRPAARRTGAEH